MTLSDDQASYWLHWKTASGAEVHQTKVEPQKFSFLSFLATAQAFQIDFLPISWDASGAIGTGGTSRIHQSLVNLDTSLAFKTHHKQHKTEEQIFRTLIAEISILSQPFVREHPNIAQLQGVCWDISSEDDKPWPVLIFEKSPMGDLYHYASHGVRDMSVEERLGLCANIGRAITDMHSNRIIHGDIKPQNILIFRDKAGTYSARVIDFGYSTYYSDDEERLLLPRSEPWNAPENDGRTRLWTFTEALRADLFCYGLLCAWLLFEPHLSQTASSSQTQRQGETKHSLCWMKGHLQQYTRQLLESAILEGDLKEAMTDFFDSSLSLNPEMRESVYLQQFLAKLDPHWTSRTSSPRMESRNSELSVSSSDFEVSKSIYDFYRTDYRVRSYIAHILLANQNQSPSLALQTAFCHYIGFGVERDERKVQEILSESNQEIGTIKKMIACQHERQDKFRADLIANIEGLGGIPWSDFTYLYLEQRRLDEAEARLKQERRDLVIVYGSSHLLAILSGDMLATVYNTQGRWREEATVQAELTKIRKSKLGPEHLDTLTSMSRLALAYRNRGWWKEAEELQMQVLETRKNKLGCTHADTLTSMANLALIYSNQGRGDEAKALQIQVMDTRKVKLGDDNPVVLKIIANLAVTYRSQGQWEDAERLQMWVMETSRTKHGENHPDTLASIANLAVLCGDQGRWQDEEILERHVLERRSSKLGYDHPGTLKSMANLATTYHSQGRYEEAEKLQVQVIETSKVKLGDDHPHTLACIGNLAFMLGDQGRLQDSEKLEEQVMESSKNTLGDDHPETLTSMANLASTYWKQGRWNEAEKLFVLVMDRSKVKLGDDHPDRLASMTNLAVTYNDQGRWQEAEILQEQALKISKIKLGDKHPDTLLSMSSLASIFQSQGRWEESAKLFRYIMEVRKARFGADHLDTLKSMSNLAITCWNQGQKEEAEQLLMRVAEAYKVKLGADHPDTLNSMSNLAYTWKSQGRHGRAVMLMRACICARRRVLGQEHPDTISSRAAVREWESNWQRRRKRVARLAHSRRVFGNVRAHSFRPRASKRTRK